MKRSILILSMLITKLNLAQDVLNPYKDYSQNNNYPEYPLINNVSLFQYSHYTSHQNPGYNGEYEIDIGTIPHTWHTNFPNLAKSYKIETVSFPFTMPCAFDPTGCADGTSNRDLYMPNDPYTGDWGFLTREMQVLGIFDYNQLIPAPTHQTLVTYAFCNSLATPPPIGRSLLPHTILKHTTTIHCGPDEVDNPVHSVSWYYDNTRGRMRYYPFSATNTVSSQSFYDIIFFPEFLRYDPYYGNLNDNYIENYSTLNYFPYTEITNASNCQLSGTTVPTSSHNFGGHVYPNDNLLVSAPARSGDGKFLAGFTYNNVLGSPLPNPDYITLYDGAEHEYFIDKGFPDLDLKWINPTEKIIFNPIKVSVISQTSSPTFLRFPTLYTFKTILGVYPSLQQVNRSNTVANGGPYTDLREVPVPVNAIDLMLPNEALLDFPEVSWDDPTTSIDDRYGYYYIENLGQITVEPCLRIFDAKFVINQGGTLLFEDYPTVINPDRFQIIGNGGAIAKNRTVNQYLQNTIVTQPQHIAYKSFVSIEAGRAVDPTIGAIVNDYVLEAGSDVEFVTEDVIRLKDGFSAKEGSTFRAHTLAILGIQTCTPWNLAGGGNGSRSAPLNIWKQGIQQHNMLISPNPAKNQVTISCNDFNSGMLYISDIAGRLVVEQSFNSIANADLSELNTGIYIAELRDTEGRSVKGKLVKE